MVSQPGTRLHPLIPPPSSPSLAEQLEFAIVLRGKHRLMHHYSTADHYYVALVAHTLSNPRVATYLLDKHTRMPPDDPHGQDRVLPGEHNRHTDHEQFGIWRILLAALVESTKQ